MFLSENRCYIARRAQYTRAWDTGSFLVLSDHKLLLQVFYDLQLKPDSQELALKSLLRFLDSQYPNDINLFLNARARNLKRVAFRWLASGEGRRFWGSDETHIQEGEMTEDFGVLQWSEPDACDEMIYNVRELLVMMKPMMKHFYEVSLLSLFAALLEGLEMKSY